MTEPRDVVCIILAGGQGKRMASADKHKVCFPVAGVPTIVRGINTYKAAGLRRFVVVAGQMAEQVVATVAKVHPEVAFVYQAQPRGTGHAALVAVEALAAQGFRGDVLIVMGDKVTRPEVVEKLLASFFDSHAELAVATLPRPDETNAGRVLSDSEGRVLGIVESADIRRAQREDKKIRVAGRSFTAEQVEARSPSINGSMYVFRFDALRDALHELDTENAQGELYLTDTVAWLARRGRVRSMRVEDPNDLMGYNTPQELLAIEEVVLAREGGRRIAAVAGARVDKRALKPAGQWRKLLATNPPALRSALRKIYGADADLLARRREAMAKLVEAFIRRHGDRRPMVICRAPGRINLMGRHVDHRGGYVNVMAIDREVLLAAALREDDVVHLANVQAKAFPDREFRINELLRETSWSDWMDFVNSSTVRRMLDYIPGDWSHYARAPLLRLQYECRQVQLRGMDCLVSGDIPMGAGLSSSSAMVVAFAEAATLLNSLDVAMRDFIDLCGEGEWFVGSRGGAADHAAIRTSHAGAVSRIGFFPFRLEGEAPFPADLRVVVAHSGSQAIKSAGARDVFNQRVACYELAMMLLKREWPPAAGAEHLRDLSPERLKIAPAEILHALTLLPERPTRRQLRRLTPADQHDRLETVFSTHADLGPYDLRGVALYGIAECVRSEAFSSVLQADDRPVIGAMMRSSHDGDRVVRFGPDGRPRRHVVRTDDRSLGKMAAEADLAALPGRYACSTEAVDHLVDIAGACEGVVGAQLAGAGLGGCMMILVRDEAVEPLMGALRKGFYEPRGLAYDAHVCQSVAGAGVLTV